MVGVGVNEHLVHVNERMISHVRVSVHDGSWFMPLGFVTHGMISGDPDSDHGRGGSCD